MADCLLNICIIDDDRIYQFAAKKTIEATRLAKKITVFSNGEEAIEYLKSIANDLNQIPDIIFLDINMPVMNGWEFLEAYKTMQFLQKKLINIYVVSSSVSDYDIVRSKEFSAVSGYVIKPVCKDKFLELLLPLCI
ncbi:MAG: response regulator [Chitinophagaceae bacterium]